MCREGFFYITVLRNSKTIDPHQITVITGLIPKTESPHEITDITDIPDFIENDICRSMVVCQRCFAVLCGAQWYVWCCVWCWCWCCVCTCGVTCCFGGVCACVVVVRVWVVCDEAWHAETPPVCRFKTPACVRSGRLRVYRQHARMFNTCGPVASTHGDVLNVHTEAF